MSRYMVASLWRPGNETVEVVSGWEDWRVSLVMLAVIELRSRVGIVEVSHKMGIMFPLYSHFIAKACRILPANGR